MLESSAPPKIGNLNNEQQKAVFHYTGPILVFAGAGSGKTRVLTHRIAHLILERKVPPEQILAVTFTNKAATEMKERLHSLINDYSERLTIGTFHSVGLKILRRHSALLGYKDNFTIVDTDDAIKVMKDVLKRKDLEEKKSRYFLSIIDKSKNSYLMPDDLRRKAKDCDQIEAAEVYHAYQCQLLESNSMDFGDLLVNLVRLFEERPEILNLYQNHIRFVLVDEFQDTNPVQYMFLTKLVEKHRNIFVVGDDDQSIYAFRGANIKNILSFEKEFPECSVIKLEQNYRSTRNILDVAYAVIKNNSERTPKKLWTENEAGDLPTIYEAECEISEAEFVTNQITQHLSAGGKKSDIAIFYRTNAQSRALEDELMKAGIKYRIFGALRFYERKEIKDVIAYLKIILNERDHISVQRIINLPARGIGPQSVEKVREHAAVEHMSMVAAAKSLYDRDPKKFSKLKVFIDLYDKLKEVALQSSLGDLVLSIIELSGYKKELETIKTDESFGRLENLSELCSIATVHDNPEIDRILNIQNFLDKVSLTASNDITDEEDFTFVSLMTLHLAKGLEFPVVYLTGLEEGLLPHFRSLEDDKDLEEERRLFYVGVTRAMKKLYITRAINRGMFSSGGGFGHGGTYRMPSRFMYEIPQDLVEMI